MLTEYQLSPEMSKAMARLAEAHEDLLQIERAYKQQLAAAK